MRRAAPPVSRVHVPATLTPGAHIELPPAAAHHLLHVLRIVPGDHLLVFNEGIEYLASITRIAKGRVTASLVSGTAVDRETPLDCTLAQAISSGERMDFTIQKAVELGVKTVQPLFSERSVVRLSGERVEKRVAHWRQVMISACEQCGRNVVPELAPPLRLDDWLAQLGASAAGELRILLSPQTSRRPADFDRPNSVKLLAGPEGGYSPEEVTRAHARGFAALRLGPRVLRTETAALVALAVMNALWGDI